MNNQDQDQYEPYKPEFSWTVQISSKREEYEKIKNYFNQICLKYQNDWNQEFRFFELKTINQYKSGSQIGQKLWGDYLGFYDSQYSMINFLQFQENKDKKIVINLEKCKSFNQFEKNLQKKNQVFTTSKIEIQGEEYRLGDHKINLGYYKQEKDRRSYFQIVIQIQYLPLNLDTENFKKQLIIYDQKDKIKSFNQKDFYKFLENYYINQISPVFKFILGQTQKDEDTPNPKPFFKHVDEISIKNIDKFVKEYIQYIDLNENEQEINYIQLNEIISTYFTAFGIFYTQK